MKLEQAAPLTEKQFQAQVVALAQIYRWRVYHPFLSKWSERGFPDLTMVRSSDRRLMFVELKRETGRLTEAQADWIDSLRALHSDDIPFADGPRVQVFVWRPSDWADIERELR